MQNTHFNPNRQNWKSVLFLSALLLGITAFLISAKIEFVAVSIMLPFKGSDAYLFQIEIVFLIVIVFEGLKAYSMIFDRYQFVSGNPVALNIRGLSFFFKLFLFILSAWCTLSLCAYYMTEYQLKESLILHQEQLVKTFNNQLDKIELEWNPIIDKYVSLRDQEIYRPGTNGVRRGEKYYTFDDQYKQALIIRDSLINEKTKAHQITMDQSTDFLRKQEVYHNPLMNAFRYALNEIQIEFSYQQCVYTFSLLISILLELAIYMAFAMAANLIFPDYQSD